MESSVRRRAIELLSVEPSQASLLALISWLDLQCRDAPGDSLSG